MEIRGDHLIGSSCYSGGGAPFVAQNPADGKELPGTFTDATPSEVSAACTLAESAFDAYRLTPAAQRADFLELIAREIDNLGETLIDRVHAETALPVARLRNERSRTIKQLQLFAEMLRNGSWCDQASVTADAGQATTFKATLARRDIGVGPVAIFGASNFPLAYSVAGGDTASALAAGCPVVVKAHPCHPGTSELVGRAIQLAATKSRVPEGVFSLLFGAGTETGRLLACHPAIKAIGFTGSKRGGLALVQYAANRSEPIPVFAEMGSINPVFLLPDALSAAPDGLADGLAGSVALGVGQFCTNPGLIVACAGPELDKFLDFAANAINASSAATMLSAAIARSYHDGLAKLDTEVACTRLAKGPCGDGPNMSSAALYRTNSQEFCNSPSLADENFGPSSLVVECQTFEEMIKVAECLEGQLTCSVHFNAIDMPKLSKLIPILERKCGRVVGNGWPTGVEVSPAMVHGGPFPSSSDSRTSSVGTLAIRRFLRPVCYQDIPPELYSSL